MTKRVQLEMKRRSTEILDEALALRCQRNSYVRGMTLQGLKTIDLPVDFVQQEHGVIIDGNNIGAKEALVKSGQLETLSRRMNATNKGTEKLTAMVK